ncbi:MAG TPA: hypothetical protein DER13_03885 [Clostridiales bacterium]|mgnify:FL=1|jgi:type IV secretory pathway VirB2 component (pilin)|nr:hypothetical protein [Clostridiales bacterium]
MKNKTLKIIAVLLIAIALITLSTTIVRATTGFEPIEPKPAGTAGEKVTNTAGQILTIVRIVGMAVAVIMLTILGIKYVAASPNEKADYKKGMTVYVVGAVLLFGASALLSVIQKFVEGK